MSKIFRIIFLAVVAVIVVAVTAFAVYFFAGKTQVKDKITWGVDFSQSQAEYLKLDWKETYSAIINDLGVKNIKLHTNWNWVEGKKDTFYFKDIDWQIEQAEKNNVKIIYVIGIKTGRWPECHTPLWAQNLLEKDQQEELLNYITEVVQRYKNSKAIAFWQVENEPLFRFGNCPAWYYKSQDFLKKEVALVKSLDPSRQIIISDSGEQSTWADAAKIADVVGVTMYRSAWAHLTDTVGFNMDYAFLNASTYARKSEIIKKIFNKDVICIELQAEPWASKALMKTSLKEQEKLMNLEIFKENVDFAKQTGMDKFYFWGVEWWYWMKTVQNQPDIWNQAKTLF
jgi:hypothetical protein